MTVQGEIVQFRKAPIVAGAGVLVGEALTFPTMAAAISAHLVRGRGRPVLFIHGNSSCKEIWRHQLRELALAGRSALALDLPGHGMSANALDPRETYSFPGYAAVLEDVLEQLGWSAVDVVGWSLGGHIGLQLYATSRRVNSLLIVGTPPVPLAEESLEQAFFATPVMQLAGKEDFSGDDARRYLADTLGAHRLATPALAGNVMRTDGCARRFMMENALNGVGIDQRRAVETISKPLCVVHGACEPFVRLDYLESIDYRCLWNNRIHVIPGAGHAPHWQFPQAFNGIMTDFLFHT